MSTLVISGATIHTATREVVTRGTVLIEDGVIQAVGYEVAIPSGCEVIDAHGLHAYPGLVDAHSHLGLYEEGIGKEGHDGNEATCPTMPHLRAIDGMNPYDRGFAEACANGVTAAHVVPASSNLIGGQGLVAKTYGACLADRIVKDPSAIKFALGENPRRTYRERRESPSSRMGSAWLIRQELTRALNYRAKRQRGEGERDLRMEALVRLLEGEMPAHVHAHRLDDIMTALRLSEEFGFRLILVHGADAHLIAGELAARRIPVVLGPLTTSRQKLELKGRTLETTRILAEHGVLFAIASDHPVTPSYTMPIGAIYAVTAGLAKEEALRAMTINPATILGVGERLGSIEPGKDADVILLDREIFDVQHRVRYTIVGGKVAYAAEAGTPPVI